MKHKEKKQEVALQHSAEADRAAIQPSQAEIDANARTHQFNQQVDSGADIKDITALNPYYQIYQGALSQQQDDRHSNGIIDLARGGNPAQAQAYDTYMKYKRQQDAAGGLQQAFSAANVSASGANKGFPVAAGASEDLFGGQAVYGIIAAATADVIVWENSF
jgi:hypothetical protein